jgi:hypothetical protein
VIAVVCGNSFAAGFSMVMYLVAAGYVKAE